MAEVIGVRFKDVGKVYFFDPDGKQLKKFDKVIVETARGIECGEVAAENREVKDEEIVHPLKKLIRIATEKDLQTVAENKEKEKKAFDICLEKIEKHGLDMKLVDVEYTFDNSKILFYFTSDGRFQRACKRPCICFQNKNRASSDWRKRRVKDGRRSRYVRKTSLLFKLPR